MIHLSDTGEETNIGENLITTEVIDFNVHPDSDLIVAMAQVPVKWKWKENGNFVEHRNPGDQWELIKQTLEEIKNTKFDGRTVDIAVFPEWSIPHEYAGEQIKSLVKEFNSDFILLAGFDFAPLEEFVRLLENSANTKKKEQTVLVRDKSSDYEHIKKTKPVNFCSIIVKSGETVKQYFQSKLFPSVYEQTGSRHSQILQGKYLLHFKTKAKEGGEKSRLRKFSFLPLICFDQLYEKTEAGSSIIEELIDFVEKEEAPGFIFILQYNPRMDHEIIDDPLYEYYLCLPTRSLRTRTYTILANVSDESGFEESETSSEAMTSVYGSLIVFNKKARFNNTSEQRLNKMGRGNLHKLEFLNTSNRLYFLKTSLLFNYQENVRSSRNPIEILQTTVYINNHWEYIMPLEFIDLDFIYLMLDKYCPSGLIDAFSKGIITNKEIGSELHNNGILVMLGREYQLARKEHIPKQLIKKLEHVVKRLNKLEKIKNEKLEKGEHEELRNIGSSIRQNTEVIKNLTKGWGNG